MTLLDQFLLPYVRVLEGAAYNVLQTLIGLGLSSTLPLLPLAALTLLLIQTSILAGFCVSRWSGSLLVVVGWLTPGVLSICHWLPDINLTPDSLNVPGTGSLGSPPGMIPLVALAVLSGWVVVILATDLLGLKEVFRHYYDYVWTLMAVAAAIFFIADSQTSEIQVDLQDATGAAQQASSYLLQQVRQYDAYCREHKSDDRVSCQWVSDVQQLLTDYSTYGKRLYWQVGPKASRDIYQPFGYAHDEARVLQIRRELHVFNESECPAGPRSYSRPSRRCQQPPAAFCVTFESPAMMDRYHGRAVAIANECVVPSLVKFRAMAEAAAHGIERSAIAKHWRWLFYLWLSTFTGGRLANATARVNGVGEYQRSIELARLACKGVGVVRVSIVRALRALVRYSSRAMRRLLLVITAARMRWNRRRHEAENCAEGETPAVTGSGADDRHDGEER